MNPKESLPFSQDSI
jgi:hypothetical protein